MNSTQKLKPINSKLFQLLARRDHTQQELSQKLQQLGYPIADIEPALQQAKQEGFINDHRFAENYIQQKSQRGYGPIRIQIALEKKGIHSETINALMPDPIFWETLASKIRKKRFGEIMPKNYIEKAKQIRFLQYRGFKIEQIIDM